MIGKDSLIYSFNHGRLAKPVVKPKPYTGDSTGNRSTDKSLIVYGSL